MKECADTTLNEFMGQFETVVVLGIDKEGKEVYASNTDDGKIVLWLIEGAKSALFDKTVSNDN